MKRPCSALSFCRLAAPLSRPLAATTVVYVALAPHVPMIGPTAVCFRLVQSEPPLRLCTFPGPTMYNDLFGRSPHYPAGRSPSIRYILIKQRWSRQRRFAQRHKHTRRTKDLVDNVSLILGCIFALMTPVLSAVLSPTSFPVYYVYVALLAPVVSICLALELVKCALPSSYIGAYPYFRCMQLFTPCTKTRLPRN